MNLERKVIFGGAAALLLGGGSLAAIALLTRESPISTPGLAPLPSVAVPAPPERPLGVPAPPDLEAARAELLAKQNAPRPAIVEGPPRAQPPEGSWEAVPPSARAADLGSQGAAVGRELNELHDTLGVCFDEDVQARNGQQPVTQVKGYESLDETVIPVLMLQLETGQGEIRIVDAPVETRGRASDGLIACAQRVLRGHVVVAPGARPGSRHRLMYQLIP